MEQQLARVWVHRPADAGREPGGERWLAVHLEGIADEGHAKVLRRHADDQVKQATAFLRWLSGSGRSLRDCRQADIDAWHAGNNQHARHVTRAFLQWCITSGLTGRFQLPGSEAGHTAPMSDEERIAHLGRVLTAGDLPLRTRAAVAIVLLYAQPASRSRTSPPSWSPAFWPQFG